jgi:hypothetical protein
LLRRREKLLEAVSSQKTKLANEAEAKLSAFLEKFAQADDPFGKKDAELKHKREEYKEQIRSHRVEKVI